MASFLLEPGSRLDQYEVICHIASGGMGEVYQAIDTSLGRTVALKILPAELADRPAALERFRREARNSARLAHKNIVTLYECGLDKDKNLYYLAMEFVDGVDLGRVIDRKGRVKPEEARRVLIQAAKALCHAFDHGIIHRDIKPSNILLARRSSKAFLKLTDFGLSRTNDDDDYRVTTAGSTVGTIDYMAPEQARDSSSADIRSDIYSLGCTAYHMLTGKAPFAEGGLGERVYKHMAVQPRDIRQINPLVSREFWLVLEKMLAKKPEDRYQTPAELLAALKQTGSEAEGNDSDPPFPALVLPTTSSPSMDAPVMSSFGDERRTPLPSRGNATTGTVANTGGTPISGVTMEQYRAGATLYERACEVIAQGKNDDYARQLLLGCLKLDPTHTACRKTLREINEKRSGGLFSYLVGSMKLIALRARMRVAQRNGNWRKVIEKGEAILAHRPNDIAVHQDMAAAAQALDLPALAVWLLEQAREQSPQSKSLLTSLAEVHEKKGDLNRAVSVWQQVGKLDPHDVDVKGKINTLSVRDHIRRANYRR